MYREYKNIEEKLVELELKEERKREGRMTHEGLKITS